MSQAFYRKWRPQKWEEVVSQEHVVQTLRNAVRTGRIGHAYLMAGPRGTGKTTTARLLAKALNCLAEDQANRPCDECEHCQAINAGRFMDLIEIDAASNTSVDDVRELRDKINFSPSQGRCKVYIIDEVHMLSTAAFNALLKTLEEPPPHAIFILATTEVHKIPATVLSRCQRYEFRRIPVGEIVKHLRAMAKEEKLEVEEEALQLIARQATGAMRDAISLLDQLASTGEKVTLKEAQVVLGTATSGMVIDMIQAVLAKDAAHGMEVIHGALDSGTDARQFARQVVDYLRSLLLVRVGNADQVDATAEQRKEMMETARQFEIGQLLETIRLFNSAATDTRASWHPGLGLELALAESIAPRAEVAQQVVQAPAAQVSVPVRTPVERQSAPVSQPAAAKPARSAQAEPDIEEPPDFEELSAPAQKPAQPAQPVTRPAQQPPAGQKSAAAQTQPAKQPEAQQPPAAPAGSGKAVSLQDVNQNWQRIKQAVKNENPLSSAALNSSRPMQIKDGILILGFQSEVVKSKMETEENIKILRKALQSILGATLGIRCIVANARSGSAGDLDVDGDGMVGTALNLGGKIAFEE